MVRALLPARACVSHPWAPLSYSLAAKPECWWEQGRGLPPRPAGVRVECPEMEGWMLRAAGAGPAALAGGPVEAGEAVATAALAGPAGPAARLRRVTRVAAGSVSATPWAIRCLPRTRASS